MSIERETRKIRKIIKKQCPTLSVRMGRGTALDFIRINGSKDKFGRFTGSEKRCLDSFNIKTGLGGGTNLDADDKRRFLKKFGGK